MAKREDLIRLPASELADEVLRLKQEVNKLTAFNARRMDLERRKQELEKELQEVNNLLAQEA